MFNQLNRMKTLPYGSFLTAGAGRGAGKKGDLALLGWLFLEKKRLGLFLVSSCELPARKLRYRSRSLCSGLKFGKPGELSKGLAAAAVCAHCQETAISASCAKALVQEVDLKNKTRNARDLITRRFSMRRLFFCLNTKKQLFGK